MNIGRQWADRLKIWSEQFEKHYVRRHGALCVSYFTTMEQLSLAQARQRDFHPAPAGLQWGRKWEYGWFHTQFTVPEELAGERLMLFLRVGEEMLVWVNGAEAGAIDKKHAYIPLTREAKAGEVFDIYAECYAGHGVRNEGAGPVAYGENPVPEPPETQVMVKESYIGIWNETVFQAAMDYRTLYSLAQKLPDKSLRTMKIVEGLKRFTYMADFELPPDELTASVAEAAKALQPLLECRNGSTAPEYTIFGQSHLDMAWLWPVEETMRKTARTYANQLSLMDEYDDYQFLMCEPPIMEYLRALYPNVYRRVMDKTAEGRFLPEGAMWIESDTNIPSGESLIRQFVRGKRWFREQTGTESRLAWMPDTFGFSAQLPQIMRKCGIPYFATQKLVRQDPEAEPFPYNVFWWEGIDGSRVLSHLYKKNNANFDSGDLITRWEDDRIQQENIDGLIYPFGFGDGGGGPTREMLEIARRCRDLEGAPRCRMESPVRYFERQQHVENVYRGELYLAWHRGTLTAQAKTKRLIALVENRLREAEFCMAQRMVQGQILRSEWREQLDEAWKLLLFNQFHDIAAGASIHRVHERAEQELEEAHALCIRLIRDMTGEASSAACLMNPLSWPVRYDGVEIPAQGSAEISDQAPAGASVQETADGYRLMNAHLICRISRRGEVISVQDHPGHEYLAGPGNRFLMFKDVNTCYDAWELGSMYENLPVELEGDVHIAVWEETQGAALMVERTLGHSPMRQIIFLGHDDSYLSFHTDIDWQEKHRLLKVSFPVNVHAQEAIHGIQFGSIRRPNHRSRPSDRDRYEVCQQRYTALADGAHGAAVLSRGKYGVNVLDNDIRLTLLRAPMMPDATADQGMQYISYAFDPFAGDFQHSHVHREAAEFVSEPIRTGALRAQPICVPAQANIVVETIKPADTVPNALLVRAYECMGMQTETAFKLHPSILRAGETDMLEENERPVDRDQPVAFGAFEIKTFLLHLQD